MPQNRFLAITLEFYALVADTAIAHQSEVAPLVRQSFPPRQQAAVPELTI